MNHEQFIENQLKVFLQTDNSLACDLSQKIIEGVIEKYRQSSYEDLDHLIGEAQYFIGAYSAIAGGVTVKEVAVAMNASVTTARKYLNTKLDHVHCNREKRPFIYSLVH